MKRNNLKMIMKRDAFLITVLTILTVLPGCASKKEAVAADSVPDVQPRAITAESIAAEVVGDVMALNCPWTAAELSGKLRAEGLPLSPTLKIYMERDSVLSISARAPFVGEVVRLDLTGDSLIAVNKLKKVYCRESADELREIYPTLCGELQSLLLGRVIVPGRGELSEENIDAVDIAVEGMSRRLGVALGESGESLNLDWEVLSSGLPRELLVSLVERQLLTIGYVWKEDGGYDITATTTRKGSPFVVEINFDAPKWDAGRLSPVKIGNGFRQVRVTDFIKSF